ncbi:MAG: hypothetical protein ACFFH0_12300 [Promethearchaeota archaeon]
MRNLLLIAGIFVVIGAAVFVALGYIERAIFNMLLAIWINQIARAIDMQRILEELDTR